VIDLVAHPQTLPGAVRGVHAGAARAPRGLLALRYRIEGDLERLRIAPPRAPAIAERLWEHSCCEVFIAPAGAAGYQEFNFSPSGEWAAYAFQGYRQGDPWRAPDPQIDVRRSGHELELRARIPAPAGRLRVALCAVIEDREGVLSYWALRHPAGKPDFHHPDGFALELE
jgi:hypothetical protein